MRKLFFMLLTINSCNGFLADFEMPQYESAITKAVADVVLNFYLEHSSTVNLVHATKNSMRDEKLKGTINEILYQLKNQVQVQVEDVSGISKSNRKKTQNVFFCDSYESFQLIMEKVHSDDFEYQGFYLIVLTQYEGNLYYMMKRIFNDLWLRHIVNANVLWMPKQIENEVMMYTFYPFTSFYCSQAFPVLLNHFRNGKWLKPADYFPNKMTNIYGCVLRVATFSNPPFMYLNEHEGVIGVDGIDGILLRVLSQKMNFSMNFSISPRSWGDIYSHGTSTGASEMVIERKVNFTIGYFGSTVMRDTFMTPSFVYHTSNLIWAISPRPLASPFEKLLKPFQVAVWICCFLVTSVAFAVVCCLKTKRFKKFKNFVYGENLQHPILNIVNVTLGGSMHKIPFGNFARTILCIFIVYSFIMQNSYKGGLYKFMKINVRDPEISSTDGLIEEGFKFYLQTKSSLDSIPKIRERAVIVNYAKFSQLIDQARQPEFKGALLSSEEHLYYRNALAPPGQYISHCPEVLFTNNLVIYLTRDSCLTHQFNQLIMYLVNGGFLKNWASKFIDRNFVKQKPSSKSMPLTLKQLQGSFEVLCVGLVFSILAFSLELILKKRAQRKENLRVVNS